MALQLTGAYKRSSLANLQVRLPGIVIGGGLTAIDTATEMLAYYVVQVEKALERFETLVKAFGEARVRAAFDAEESEILDEFCAHGRAIRGERIARAGGEPRAALSGAARRGAACRCSIARRSPTRRPTASTTRRSRSASRRACASSRG